MIVLAVLSAVVAVVVVLLARRARRAAVPEPGELAALDEHSVDLDAVMASAGATLYIPIDAERTYLAVAHPEAPVEGRTSPVPSQLVAAAVAGQAALEALVNAGRLTGRLVLVDPATAKAIKAGAMVKDRAGDMLAVIRGSGGTFSQPARITPLSGGLVKSAVAGPAMLSAIALQAQLARVEKSIGEVRDAVDAVRGYLEAAEQASVEGRRDTLATVYRTAQETGRMTQSLWDQIQDLEASLRRDVTLADRALAQAVSELEQAAPGLVGSRLEWLESACRPVAAAVAGVADARRSLVQFSMLRLWWLAVADDPTLASRQAQLRELLAELPDHAAEQARTEKALAAVGELRTHHRVLAPRKHKQLASQVGHAQREMQGLPWMLVDVRRLAALEP